VSTAFRYLIQAREKLYSTGIFRTRKLDHPVVSVGNLTLGGTGKTPLVIALAEKFRDLGFRPVILSRGYKRKGRGIVVVGDSWEEAGDEPYLMARRLKNVPVVVGADRYEAGRAAEQKNLGNIFLLDDGFQHRQLHRDVDIVAIDLAEWSAGEALLPTGKWREPKSAIRRADLACYQDSANLAAPDLPVPSFRFETRIDGLYIKDAAVPVETLQGKEVVAFAAIAKPERFFKALETMGIEPREKVTFRDHHAFSQADIEKLGSGILITTEKDGVRLLNLVPRDFIELRISANIPDFAGLMEIVMGKLNK
jgi:tetraacyldisaccharide 4'-kinase